MDELSILLLIIQVSQYPRSVGLGCYVPVLGLAYLEPVGKIILSKLEMILKLLLKSTKYFIILAQSSLEGKLLLYILRLRFQVVRMPFLPAV